MRRELGGWETRQGGRQGPAAWSLWGGLFKLGRRLREVSSSQGTQGSLCF